jgi:hypothetical protein
MPPWLLRLLADTTPERAVETAIRAYRLRGIEFQSRNEAGDLTLETTCRWIRSGSRLLHLVEEDTFFALDRLGDEPRWHALTTPEPGPVYVVRRDELGVRSALAPEGPGGLSDYIDTLARVRVLDGGHYTDPLIAVQPSPDGPIVTAWIRQTTGEWATALGVSGSWDLFRWAHLRSRGADEPFSAIWMLNLNAVLNAVAAIIEAREVVRVQAARKRRKGARGARKGRGVRPEVYRLDPHALSSWTERVVRETPSDAPRRSPASTDVPRTVRLHTCREHTRRTWVLSPAEGEPVVETRLGRERQDGTRATLYCVMRRVQAHARGTGIAPRPIRLVPSD